MKTLRLMTAVAVSMLVAISAMPAQKSESETRSVRGQVIDNANNPVPKAVVYLKNTKNVQVRTQFADGSGSFQFQGLNFNVDYQVHAEHEGASSSTRTISSFDNRKEVNISLKLEKK